jgi:hypothetical protein
MLDALLRNWTKPALAALARKIARRGPAVALAGLTLGLVALPLFALGFYLAGLGVLLASRVVSALAAGAARETGNTAALAAGFAFDAVVLAGVPFAFALGDPTRALSAVFLIFALSANTASAFAFADSDGLARGLVGSFEVLIAIAFASVFPERFALIAYVLGVLCFVAAGARLAPHVAQGRSP